MLQALKKGKIFTAEQLSLGVLCYNPAGREAGIYVDQTSIYSIYILSIFNRYKFKGLCYLWKYTFLWVYLDISIHTVAW